jgi:hypothetical protein
MGQPEDEAVDPRTRPLAPTFVAPLPVGRREGKRDRRRVATSPSMASLGRPATAAHGTVDTMADLPRAFDAEQAHRLRPPTPIPSAFLPASTTQQPGVEPVDVPILDADPDQIPPPAGALPLLVQPPPSPGRDERPKVG